MAEQRDDQQAIPPTAGVEDGDILTDEEEAALDKAVAQITDEQLRASIDWVNSWAEEDKKPDDQ